MSRIPTRLYPRLPCRLPPLKRYSNYCLSFAAGQYVNTAAFVPPSSGAIETWIRPAASMVPPPPAVFPYISGFLGEPTLIIQANTGRPYLQHNIGGILRAVLGTALLANVWTRITVTWAYDGANTALAIYQNGVLTGGPTSWVGAPPIAAAIFRISNPVAGNEYVGLQDEVHLLSVVPSAQEIRESFLRGYAQRRSGSELILRLEEGTGLTAYDGSGNARNGCLLPALTPPAWTEVRKHELLAEARV